MQHARRSPPPCTGCGPGRTSAVGGTTSGAHEVNTFGGAPRRRIRPTAAAYRVPRGDISSRTRHVSHWPTNSIWCASRRANDACPPARAEHGPGRSQRQDAHAMPHGGDVPACAGVWHDGPRGENTGRTRRRARAWWAVPPRRSTPDVPSPRAAEVRVRSAKSGRRDRTMTFSSREKASSVQFVEPVHTSAASRTAYL